MFGSAKVYKGSGLLMSVMFFLGYLVNPAVSATPTVVINEIDCRGNDWIELFNQSAQTIDISGWTLSDKAPTVATGPHLYVFPGKTLLAAKSFLVVQQTGLGDQQLTFGVPCSGGQSVYLAKPITSGTFDVVNTVLVPTVPSNAAIGRLPNGSGKFAFTSATKGKANVSASPAYVGVTRLVCGVKKVCRFQLKATNAAVFQLTRKVRGVSVGVSGKMIFSSHMRGTYQVPVTLLNPSGTTRVSLSIVVK